MVCHVSRYFKETFISWWWEYLPYTFYEKKLVFKGGCAGLFVMGEDRNCFGGNHDPAVIICAQKDRSTRARFHSVSWRPLKSLWWFKLPWALHKIIQGVSQEEVCWSCLVDAGAKGLHAALSPQVCHGDTPAAGALWGHIHPLLQAQPVLPLLSASWGQSRKLSSCINRMLNLEQ